MHALFFLAAFPLALTSADLFSRDTLLARQGGDSFRPSTAGLIENCPVADQCGGGDGSPLECLDRTRGDICCSENYGCPGGNFCLIKGFCCPDGDDPATCARLNGITLPSGFKPGDGTSSGTAASSAPTSSPSSTTASAAAAAPPASSSSSLKTQAPSAPASTKPIMISSPVALYPVVSSNATVSILSSSSTGTKSLVSSSTTATTAAVAFTGGAGAVRVYFSQAVFVALIGGVGFLAVELLS